MSAHSSSSNSSPEPEGQSNGNTNAELGLYVVVAMRGEDLPELEKLAREHGAKVRDHGGDSTNRFALFRSVEQAAEFLGAALERLKGRLALLLGEVNPGAGRNHFLDAAADLVEQAPDGQALLTEQVTDVIKTLDLLELDLQYLGPRELSGLNRATGVMRCGSRADGGENNSHKARQMDLLLMQAREEAKRERERNQRNARFMIGCFALFFMLVAFGLVGAVLLTLGDSEEERAPEIEEEARVFETKVGEFARMAVVCGSVGEVFVTEGTDHSPRQGRE